MVYWTRASLQRDTGRTRADVDRLIGLGLPHEHVGHGRGGEIRIPREAALAWFATFVLDAKDEPGSSPELTRERTRLAKEQADKLEMENATSRGELLPRAEVVSALQAVFAHCRARLLALPTRLAPLIAGEQSPAVVQDRITQGVHEALEELKSIKLVSLSED